jgi:hypothetical protein
VLYQYGMVLGLNDFLQEQTHNLGKDYHHERALHGYGTVYGLEVTTSPPVTSPPALSPPAGPNDVTITVEPGMAIDQWGREITVPTAQCALLGAWLAAQEQSTAGIVERHTGSSGELVVYVVAKYAECPDDLVPLTGQPCSTSSQVQAPSRLRDAWDIELSFTPPAMPAWDAVRQLAALLNSVEIVAGLDPALSSETALLLAVQALATPANPSSPGGGPYSYKLPTATAAEAFDRILTVWVTQVRPQLAPDLTAPDPQWEPSVLLATITLLPELPVSTASPVISWAYADDTGRPYLLHTQLIQELRLGTTTQPVQQLVTLAGSADAAGVPTLSAWFHLAQPVALPPTIQVIDENGKRRRFTTTSPAGEAFSYIWSLNAPSDFTVPDGDQLAATFGGTDVLVGDNATTLASVVAGLGYLDTTSSGDVTAYAFVQYGTPPTAAGPASTPFVTLTYIPTPAQGEPYLELWFHVPPAGTIKTVTMSQPGVQIFEDLTGQSVFPLNIPLPIRPLGQNVWAITMPQPPPTYLRVLIDTTQTQVVLTGPGPTRHSSLEQLLTNSGVRYIGWTPQTPNTDGTIVAFTRIGTTSAPAAAPKTSTPKPRATTTRRRAGTSPARSPKGGISG